MGYYLLDHPPRQTQYRARRDRVSGLIVVHTAESAPDTVAADTGAEGVASFIANRADYGGYHRLADSDSVVPMIGFDMAVFGDGTGSNDFAIHISFATQAARWSTLPADWVEGALRQGAKAAVEAIQWLHDEHGITVPTRLISRAESDQRRPGFISHALRDPSRRSDPGPDFPWTRFFNYITEEMDDMSQYSEQLDRMEKKLDRAAERDRRFRVEIRGRAKHIAQTARASNAQGREIAEQLEQLIADVDEADETETPAKKPAGPGKKP